MDCSDIIIVLSASWGCYMDYLSQSLYATFVSRCADCSYIVAWHDSLMDDRTQDMEILNLVLNSSCRRIPSALAAGKLRNSSRMVNPNAVPLLIGLGSSWRYFEQDCVWTAFEATGRNESASRFSGIHTDNVIIVAYIVCSTFAGFGGLLFSLDLNTVQPSSLGNMYEMYAIAGCVVGGVSLRGGEGQILGVIIGAAIIRVLYNAINVAGVSTQLEQVVLGLVILIGVAADEVVRMISARRKVRESMALAQKALEESRAAAANR